MQLPVITFSGLMNQMAAGLQGAAGQVIDLTIGSVLRALLESCASVALWLQWIVLQVLATTRAATSVGSDLDSWMADYSFQRLQGAPAVGIVTFARYSPGLATIIPLGSVVLTSDGSEKFVIIEDDSNPAWNGDGGYSLEATQSSVDIPAECSDVGVGGNIVSGSIGLLGSPIAGVDSVSNAAAFAGGLGAETDLGFRARFLLYINSRSAATSTAILNAVSTIRQGLRAVVIENVDADLGPRPGSFLVVVDTGDGMLDQLTMAAVQSAVELVRPVGTGFSVQGPIGIPVSVAIVLEISNQLTRPNVAAAVQAAVVAWIASLPIGGTLAISKIDALAHGVDASVMSVTSSLINNLAQDVIAPINGVIVASSVVVS